MTALAMTKDLQLADASSIEGSRADKGRGEYGSEETDETKREGERAHGETGTEVSMAEEL
jgi:hypothetical protein